MKNKTITMLALTAFLLSGGAAFANSGYEHGMMGKHHGGGSQCQTQCPVASKFMTKAYHFLKHKQDLGLTDEQVKTIEGLKLQMEKDSARQEADAKVFQLDLQSKLKEDKIDVAGTSELIDKGFASMAAGAKSNLDAYAKLKAVLTPEQLAKMKELWKNEESKESPSTKER